MAYDSLRAVHPDLPVRSVRIKKRAPTRTRCRARTVRSPWNGRHRSNVREPSESLRVRYLMLVRALSDRQNGGFRKAFLTGAVRLGTQRRRERPAGRGYRTMSTTPRSDRSANTLTRAGGVATPRPHRPATSGGGVSSRPLRRWRYASAFDTPSRAGGRAPRITPVPDWDSSLGAGPSVVISAGLFIQRDRSDRSPPASTQQDTVKGPLGGARIVPPPNEPYSTGRAGFSRNRRPPPGRAYIATSARQATRRWTRRAIQRVSLESPLRWQ